MVARPDISQANYEMFPKEEKMYNIGNENNEDYSFGFSFFATVYVCI